MQITVRHFQKNANWGDALNMYLLAKIFPQAIIHSANEEDRQEVPHLLAVGSIIHWATPHSVIWGTGALTPEVKIQRPEEVLAVRGPLTARVMRDQGVDCPDRFGDPALLLPKFFRPPDTRRIDGPVGIVPHYVDQGSPLVKQLRDRVKVIDVLADTEQFICEVTSCQCVLSSSLHGLICADAYGIPAAWIQFSDRVLGRGFKFHDYYASTGRQAGAVALDGSETPEELRDVCRSCESLPDLEDLESTLVQYLTG